TESLLAFDEHGHTFIAPRDYCKDLKPLKNNTAFLKEFLDYIDRKTPNNPIWSTDCCWTLASRHGLTKIWKQKELQRGVLAQFVATEGGITRVYPRSAGQYWTENAETYESSFYKRNLDNDLYIFTPTPYQSFGGSNETGCNDEICGCQRNDEYVDCVILDDGGFLVMSNRDEYMDQIGRFFGVVDSILMQELVNASLFTFTKTFDYQSIMQQMFVSITFPNFLEAVFIIADAKQTCLQCDSKPLVQDEQPTTGPDPCVLAQNPRHRKGPTVCFDNNKNEQDFGCGGASGLNPSLWTLLGLQLLLLWTVSGPRGPAHVPS
ncbi:hypothetical protein CRUP_025737, partial [Coryphaenoides rupestris]